MQRISIPFLHQILLCLLLAFPYGGHSFSLDDRGSSSFQRFCSPRQFSCKSDFIGWKLQVNYRHMLCIQSIEEINTLPLKLYVLRSLNIKKWQLRMNQMNHIDQSIFSILSPGWKCRGLSAILQNRRKLSLLHVLHKRYVCEVLLLA